MFNYSAETLRCQPIKGLTVLIRIPVCNRSPKEDEETALKRPTRVREISVRACIPASATSTANCERERRTTWKNRQRDDVRVIRPRRRRQTKIPLRPLRGWRNCAEAEIAARESLSDSFGAGEFCPERCRLAGGIREVDIVQLAAARL